MRLPAVLTIAGSDSSGGAGIEADLKTICSLGLYGEAAITSLTAQNTCGVRQVEAVSPGMVAAQVDAVFADIRPAAVKVGMVGSAEGVCAIAGALGRNDARNVIVDPVMLATSGGKLSDEATVRVALRELYPKATLLTPNVPEAETLMGLLGRACRIRSARDMGHAARALAERIGCAALVKGGHLTGAADDVLARPDGTLAWFHTRRVDNPNGHGTGCTLSSAIACGLARDASLEEAVREAKAYLTGCLRANLDLGHGSGPLDHLWHLRGIV